MKDLRYLVPFIGRKIELDGSLAEKELGISYQTAEESLIQMAR